MMEEADVVERVSFMESNTSKPTSTFFANLAGSRLSFTGKK